MSIYGLLTVVIASLLVFLVIKSVNERYAVFITLGGGLLLLFFICSKISTIFLYLRELSVRIGVENEYFSIILKCLGISYVAEFTAGFCKDCGQHNWAEKLELACRCVLLVLAIPLFEDFLNVIMKLLE